MADTSGSISAVNPRMAPDAASRSTRRFTAGADNPTFVPISANIARALCMLEAGGSIMCCTLEIRG